MPSFEELPGSVMVSLFGLALGLGVGLVRLTRWFRRPTTEHVATMPRRFDASRSSELVWREVQPMWGLLVLTLAVGGVLVVAGVASGRADIRGMFGVIGMVLGLAALLLGRLVTEVRGDSLHWRFGWLGWPRWRHELDDIVALELTRSRPLEGWGIRFTTEGMLYNSHGLQAVRITLRNGRRLRLGSQAPQRLIQALETRIAVPAP